MASSNPNAELNFADVQIDDVFSSNGIVQTLRKYDKLLEVYGNDPANRGHPLPAKIVKDKVVNNDLIRRWASFKAPPLLLTFTCGGLPPNGEVGVRVREIMRAFILVSAPEYQQKLYGEILNIILRAGGAIKHMAGDKSNHFGNIHTYLVDLDVLKNEASTAVSHMEQDKEGIRIDINTPVLEVVNLQTFLDLNLVVNNTEVPPHGISRTWSDMWFTANQDYYYRTPGNTSQDGDHSNLLNEEQLQRLCGHMYDFAKQVGHGLRTFNREANPSSSTGSGVIFLGRPFALQLGLRALWRQLRRLLQCPLHQNVFPMWAFWGGVVKKTREVRFGKWLDPIWEGHPTPTTLN